MLNLSRGEKRKMGENTTNLGGVINELEKRGFILIEDDDNPDEVLIKDQLLYGINFLNDNEISDPSDPNQLIFVTKSLSVCMLPNGYIKITVTGIYPKIQELGDNEYSYKSIEFHEVLYQGFINSIAFFNRVLTNIRFDEIIEAGKNAINRLCEYKGFKYNFEIPIPLSTYQTIDTKNKLLNRALKAIDKISISETEKESLKNQFETLVSLGIASMQTIKSMVTDFEDATCFRIE